MLGGLNWEGGSFARSQYPTVVYMTFFPNDEIRKFFPGFDGTLSIQYHELKLINIVLSWPNINNLTKYCVMIVHGKDLLLNCFYRMFYCFLKFIHIYHLICFYVLYSVFF